MNKLIVDRYKRKSTSTYTYVATVSVSYEMDAHTADANPETEQWLVDSIMYRLIAELKELRNNGGDVDLRRHELER